MCAKHGHTSPNAFFQVMKTDDTLMKITHEAKNRLNVGPYLTLEDREKFSDVLRKYRMIFEFTHRNLGDTKISQHIIVTEDAPPIHVPAKNVNQDV